ncbi:MAG: hypothetical protein QM668_20950 [Agriterribacter sp.]
MKIKQIILLLAIGVCTGLNASSQVVYKTPSGKKYHWENCLMVKNVSEEILINEALRLGLGPCSICKPPRSYGKTKSTYKAQGTV